MSEENVEIKSKYERDFRRFSSTRESLTKYSDLIQLLRDAHGLPSAMDVVVSYQDPSGDLVPLRDDASLSRAVLTASEPLLRLFVHMRSGHWNTEYWSGEEDECDSDVSESSFSDQESGRCKEKDGGTDARCKEKDGGTDARCKDGGTDTRCKEKDGGTDALCKDGGTDTRCKEKDGGTDARCKDGGTDTRCKDGGTDARCKDGGTDAHCKEKDGGTDAHCKDGGTDAHCKEKDGGTDARCKDGGTDTHCKDGGTDARCKDGGTDAPCKEKDGGTDARCKDRSATQTATFDNECTDYNSSHEGRTEDASDGLSYQLPLHPLLTGSITDDVTTETDSKADPEGREMSAVMNDMLPQHPLLKMFSVKQQNNEASVHQLSSLTLEQSTPTKCEDSTGSDKFDYVVEIYDFDSTLKTKDLLEEFRRDYGKHEFRLKWVDDTHALGIFPSSKQAWLAAKAPYSQFKTRLLSEGTEGSLTVAEKVAEAMRPCGSIHPPPKRTAMVARRMVASALGVKVAINPEKREREREELERAREEKRVLKSTIH